MRISDWSSDVCSSDLRPQPTDRLDDLQAGADGALGIVLVGAREAEVDQHAVAHVARDVALQPGDHAGAGVLVGAHDGAQIFRIIARRQLGRRSEEHTSELQSLMRISYAVFCLKKKRKYNTSNA